MIGDESAYETPIENLEPKWIYIIWADPGNVYYWRAGSNDCHLNCSRIAYPSKRKHAETNHATSAGMAHYSGPNAHGLGVE